MMQYMIEWLRTNRNDILKKYPEAEPELSFFMDYFVTGSGGYSFVDILKRSIKGEGVSTQETSTYFLMDSIVDEGHVVDAAEFYFYDELDGKVPFKVFASVLELIALAYAEHNLEEKEQIIHLMPRLKKVYDI
ncbi:hypothetical protein AB2R53_18735 [Acinetobacter baumannii]|uniref:hypothetical protein n=1 Tax=Acinetobacter calcoaceticus/baumannii complex TaxID=909768 RepID=UPI000278907D|nr:MULTISPECIES: hypothetical protein [Acinetobacter calcoaceticus/baumannii complex]AVI34063.1 hypothetical protein CSB70_2334 [Acinetobacter baumannii]EHU1238838.1 hypothetical protein [Acinetobacter baumannii]EHU1451466.1 hypothetical protein [Acinetobacter baumannii]EHU1571835.1 hypothetical protein [Acinetobacter baumannii]EHU1627034.1 hypothetical protein [Acinetobacter baumannii]